MLPDKSPPATFDWKAIAERFERLREAAAQADQLTPAQAEAVMAERARVLARVPPRAPDTSEILELMTLRLGNERFAIEARFVREVQRSDDITPIPGAPDFLIGVTNLRGEVLAVTDLRSLFGIAANEGDRSTQLIVLGTARPEFGVLVDDVHEVTTLRIDEVLPPPGSVGGPGRRYLRGVTKDALLILDGDVVLADEQLYMDERD